MLRSCPINPIICTGSVEIRPPERPDCKVQWATCWLLAWKTLNGVTLRQCSREQHFGRSPVSRQFMGKPCAVNPAGTWVLAGGPVVVVAGLGWSSPGGRDRPHLPVFVVVMVAVGDGRRGVCVGIVYFS